MFARLHSLFRKRGDPGTVAHAGRLLFEHQPDVLYAIGDVHGRLDLLQQAEARIIADATAFPGDRRMVLLGDYIDRGPLSAGVLDHLCRPPPEGFQRHCVSGNHEVMMLRFFFGGQHFDWLRSGGYETLRSYGVSPERIEKARSSRKHADHLLHSYIPEEHVDFLKGLHQAVEFPACDFVHFPPEERGADARSHDQQMARDVGLYVEPRETARKIVHGHRIVEAVSLDGRSINIDTGAYSTGRLSVLRIAADGDLALL